NNFYIRVKETSTGVNAFKILVRRNGGISPEPGPNMMWNAKYSPMANMMGMWFVPNARNSVFAGAGESKGAILSRPKKNALGTFRRAAQKTVVFERVQLRPSGAYKSVTYRLRRP